MAFGGLTSEAGDSDNAEINMVPLIDVMLVLLVIFIITAPLLTHAVKVDLPQASSRPNDIQPGTVTLSIKADGSVYWDAEPVDPMALKSHMATAARTVPQPEVHIRADGELAYKNVVKIMAGAAEAGLGKLGFITDPGATPVNPSASIHP